MSSNLSVFLQLAASSNQVFTDVSPGDVLLYTASNKQTIYMGNNNSTMPYIAMTSNVVSMCNDAIIRGYLGIGKNNPAYPLDVSGDVHVGGKLFIS